MVTVDLITGFLGAGKTTFIHKYLHYLQEKGYHVRIIENEFGDVSVDTELLREDGCEIDDLAGLCMCCVGKDAFIRMLQESARTGCNRIIVEPSGIYDVDEFFEVLSLPEISSLCEIGSILTIADPMGMKYMTEESEYLMFAQFLASGMIVMSKTQMLTETEIGKAIEEMNGIMKEKGCENGLMADVFTKPWDQLDEDDFEDFMDAGYARFVHDRELFSHSEAFQSSEFFCKARDQKQLQEKIERIFESPSCGVVYRIKGFARDLSGNWYEVNCTAETYSIRPAGNKPGTLVAIGQHLRETEIREILSAV